MHRRVRLILVFVLSAIAGSICASESELWADTVTLPDVEVSVSRLGLPGTKAQMQMSVADSRIIEQAQVLTPKDISSIAPNVYMPDYGSAMTSSIYVRGLGSRINEPVIGMMVDGVPMLDKNMYDHSLQDICRIELLRGPQGTLYGRNSPAGVMEIRTIRPLDLTTRLVRGEVTYGTANTVKAQASYYDMVGDGDSSSPVFGWGVAAHYGRTDGYYTNTYTGMKVDHGQQAGGRVVLDVKPTDEWRVTGTLHADWISQGAFPYAQVTTEQIAFNRDADYERIALLPSIRAEYKHAGYVLQLAASYQFMRDDMRMDQDYTVADIFTLRQTQRQHNGTADALLSGAEYASDKIRYNWQVGLSAFTKNNRMSAPVTFMREGIEELILGNANRGIQTVFPEGSIAISNAELPIPSAFGLYNAGLAVYHQSHLYVGNWHISAGLRADYEYAAMDYLSTADVNYRFTLLMDDYEDVHTRIAGTRRNHYWQLLPRVAVSYEDDQWMVYGSAAKGYKAGGFNPQIFSTITQNQVMTDLAADMGMHLQQIAEPRFLDVNITTYRPERDWTFEVGGRYSPVTGMRIDVDAFHIQCFDQQVTVFPNGKTTGRMMANAAHSRIWGAEASLRYGWEQGDWSGWVDASYGFTDARFVEYDDGIGDYSGNVIPYAPRHTAHALTAVRYAVGEKWLQAVSVSLKANMAGSIYWNEQNDCKQQPYATLAATLKLGWQHVQLQLWGRNLTNTRYDVFYFRSMGNDFLQHAKPIEAGATLQFEI